MLRYILVLSVVVMSIAGPTTPSAEAGGSEQKRFEKAVEKFALRNSVFQVSELKPRGMCVCLEGSSASKPGFLLWVDDGGGQVYCMVPFPFTSDGKYNGAGSCEGKWTMLGK
ncbi:MAG: hypothetical protein ABIR79_07535 [Candidatus Binatia bacterium]